MWTKRERPPIMAMFGAVGVDEKACRRGHSYVTLFADLEERRLLYATEGRKAGVLGEFRTDLEAHGGSGDGIGELCMDMSAAYMKGARESFPDAEVTFDRFHVVKLLNEAVEKVRRTEQKGRPELKRSRWLWLWNPERLTPDQRDRLDELLDPSQIALDTAEAYRLKEAFQEFWDLPPTLAGLHLELWCLHAEESGLAPMATAAQTIRKHSAGILRWLHSRISNGMLEAMNSLIQAAKVRARGYRTTEELHHHRLPRLRQTRFQLAHLKQRGATSAGGFEFRASPGIQPSNPQR